MLKKPLQRRCRFICILCMWFAGLSACASVQAQERAISEIARDMAQNSPSGTRLSLPPTNDSNPAGGASGSGLQVPDLSKRENFSA